MNPDTSTGAVRVLPLEFLERRLAQWQKICRMQDWTMEIRIAREMDFHDKARVGETERWNQGRHVRISLMDPLDHNKEDHISYDMEQVLAHEFAHVVCWAWRGRDGQDAGSIAYDVFEQSMEVISYALCAIPVDFPVVS